jgi:putative NADPH-quinone reductase
MKKILVILGHPNPSAFNAALAKEYAAAAQSAGHQVEVLSLVDLQFDPILRMGYAQAQALEPDLLAAQSAIMQADHLVFVYPSWWGSVPALLKGFIDRAFLPGFAFKYKKDSPWWDRLLAGRTAHLIVTMDTPGWYNWLMYGNSNIKAMKAATLQFCGVSKVKVTTFTGIRTSTPDQRAHWLGKVGRLGRDGM